VQIERTGELSIIVRNRNNKQSPETRVNFDNAYLEYERDPDALADVLHRWARFATEPLEDSQMTERVVSVLRSRELVTHFDQEAAARAPAGVAPSSIVWRPFAGDIVEIVAFDGAETIQYATEEALAELGLSPEQAWETAPRNLPSRLGELELGGVEGADSLVFVTGGNGLAPSTLIDGRICLGEGATSIFLLVDRNGFIMADGADSRARLQFVELLNDLRQNGNSLSLSPLGCRDGRVAAVVLTE
jgi:hypothetical protein